jgi:hypothetical protein
MTIRPVLSNGQIQPLEPIPPEWPEGQELVVEQPEISDSQSQIPQWSKELDSATAEIPSDEHGRFRHALDEIEREGKEMIRREWGLP